MNNYTLQTILFEPSNTCVCHMKQYCLASETILFRPSSTNVSVTERYSSLTITLVMLCLLLVWTDGRSFRKCDFDGRYVFPLSILFTRRLTGGRMEGASSVVVARWILQTAWNGKKIHRLLSRLRKGPLWSDSFDKVTSWRFVKPSVRPPVHPSTDY